MTTMPPYLKNGDTIGIVCPSGHMPFEKAETCINVLQQWGYKVVIGKTLGNQHNYFSGTDEERLEDLQYMLDNDGINAVLCGRGGYGLSRIIDKIDFKKFRRKPKWIIGYSDITVLHAHIYSRYKIASIHSPMAAAFNDGEHENEYIQSLRKVLVGKKLRYKCEDHKYNQYGRGSGTLVGGNLSLLVHLIGTKSDVDTGGKILFLEDVGEYIYHVDRMFYQLQRSGKLKDLAGLIIGGFTDMKDTVIPFGKSVYDTIYDISKQHEYPVCFDFPVSHERENFPLKVGAEYSLTVKKSGAVLVDLS